MTTATMQTTDRRGMLKMALVGAGGAVLVRALSVPGLGEVITGDHAVERHATDALTVREFMASSPAISPVIWMQPPCNDGRYRIIVMMRRGLWAVWVLVKLNANTYAEVTAFATDRQDYVQAVRDDCGNGGFFQHA